MKTFRVISTHLIESNTLIEAENKEEALEKVKREGIDLGWDWESVRLFNDICLSDVVEEEN